MAHRHILSLKTIDGRYKPLCYVDGARLRDFVGKDAGSVSSSHCVQTGVMVAFSHEV